MMLSGIGRKGVSGVRAAMLLALLAGGVATAQPVVPVQRAFTYQGELSNLGSAASGLFDMRFRLYTAASGGTQVGSLLCADDVVVEGGRFSVSLDFGQVFDGSPRFLEIEVRPDGGTDCGDADGFTALVPRQEMTSAPHANFAAVSTVAAYADAADSAQTASRLGGQLPSFYLDAANLTGTLADSRLSLNVAKLDGNNTFTGIVNLNNPANVVNGVFSGNGAAITGLNGANIAAGTVARDRLSSDLSAVLAPMSAQTAQVPVDWTGWGANSVGQRDIPVLPPGVRFTKIDCGENYNLGLRSDGQLMGWGDNTHGQLNVPPLPPGVTYVTMHAGFDISVAKRSDGQLVCWGKISTVPALPVGTTYTDSFDSGIEFIVALRSDGQIVSWGPNAAQVANPPVLPSGVTYTKVAAGWFHGLALRSDGQAEVWGNPFGDALNKPALAPGVTVTAISAETYTGAMLLSTGEVVSWGYGTWGHPAPPPGMRYTAIDAGGIAVGALRSDGAIVIAGADNYGLGQTTVPALPSGLKYQGIVMGGGHAIGLRGMDVSYRADQVGVAVGGAPAPAAGGLSVAGSSRFAADVAAASFSGSGAGLTGLDASNITLGTLSNARTTGTAAATANTLVMRDASGNFSAGTITAALNGNASSATTATDALNATNAANAANLGGQPASFYTDASNISAGTLPNTRTTGTAASTANTLVLRDAFGNFSAGTVTANLNGNAANAANATNLSGQPGAFYTNASNLSAGTLANARTTGTAAGTANTLVLRDATGNFSAGTITAALNGNATSATTASNATNLGGQPASFYTDATNMIAGTLSNTRTTGTAASTANTLVLRDASGNFSAGTITATLNGNAATATNATNATNATTAANATNLGGQAASFYTNASNLTAGTLANARTTGVSTSTANTLVLRDASGNFSAGTITAALNGNATTATTATNATNATTAANATNLGGQPAAFYTNAANMSAGTLPDARLSANVPLLGASNTFTGALNSFDGAMSVDTAAGSFTVDGLAPSGAAAAVDQNHANRPNLVSALDMWQSFTPSVTGQLTRVDIDGSSGISGSSRVVTMTIYAGEGTGGAVLASNSATLLDVIGETINACPVTTPPLLVAGQTYTIRLVGTGSVFNVRQSLSNTYPGGRSSVSASSDLAFKTYMSAASARTALFAGFGGVGVGTNAPITTLDINGRVNISNGVIQRGGPAITTTADLGLYSQVSGNFMRFVTNAAPFNWYTDSGIGSAVRMSLTAAGALGVGTSAPTGAMTVVGNATITGSLAKGGGSFKIDHPLDPENQYLYHSFVESPDMKNIYDGVVVTDAAGYATITLPDYFEALNRDFRYQLTVIDENAPDVHFVRVVSKVGVEGKNQFTVKSTPGNMEISWTVTGIRQDAWANQNRIPNAVEKSASEKGKYLHPRAFGKPDSAGVYTAEATMTPAEGQSH